MSGYTLKLDLTEYERFTLLSVIRKALAEERAGEAPRYYEALRKIKDEINDYLDCVEEVQRMNAEERRET